MKKIVEQFQTNKTLDLSIFDDLDIVKFKKENNLATKDLISSYADVREYLENKDKYKLIWSGILELHLEKEKKNEGLKYLYHEMFRDNIDINDLKLTSNEKKEAISKCYEYRNKGFYLHGKNGVGKTFFAVALANERFKKNKNTTLFVFWPEFIQNMKKFERDSFQMLERVKRSKYLIIDDLGQETISSWSRDDILNQIITFRLENKLNTIITSNYEVKELYKLYTLNPIESKKVKSIFSKMETLSKPIVINGVDLRKEF